MIRDVTGLNEARDGSMPEKDALVGIQKMAANTSNTATKHLLSSLIYLALRTCENISLKTADIVAHPLHRQALANSISTFNTNTLEELASLQLHDFGIYLQMEPEEEEKAILEQNVQVALQTGAIALSDAIDIREIKNMKLANQYIKLRQTQKLEREQAQAQANIQSQAQANAQQAEQAAMNEVQKQQALTETNLQFEQGRSQMKIQQIQMEGEIKKQLMAEEFNYNMQLAQVKVNAEGEKEKEIEDRKDERSRIQATQQSEMISQRKNDSLPTDFETTGGDMLDGFGLDNF